MSRRQAERITTCVSQSAPGCKPNRSRKESLEAIVEDYVSKYKKENNNEHRFYAGQKCFEDALLKAATARMINGKCHPHQRRVGIKRMTVYADELKKYDEEIQSAKSFDELFNIISDVAMRIPGIGELCVYDTAHRLGAYLKLAPEHVYLHAGTREGAKALGFDPDVKYIPKDKFPLELQELQAHEIEDCLCIYKEALKQLAG